MKAWLIGILESMLAWLRRKPSSKIASDDPSESYDAALKARIARLSSISNGRRF